MALKELSCPRCGASLKADAVDMDLGVVTCCHCRALFALPRGRVAGGGPPAAPSRGPAPLPPPPRRQLVVPLPPGIEVQPSRDQLMILRRWSMWGGVSIFVFGLFFVVPVFLVGVSAAVSAGMPGMCLGILAPLGIGGAMVYSGLAQMLNRTTIHVDRKLLAVAHGPVPSKKGAQYHAGQIRQLYCRERAHSGKNGTSYSYAVWLLGEDGKQYQLVGGLDNVQQALYIEQQIEQFLGIDDVPVAGEVSK